MKSALIIVALLTSAFAFSSEWQQRADFGSHGRHRGTGISIGTKGYIGLGHYNGAGPNIILNDWWEYDPATNAWTQKADYPAGNGVGDYGVISFGVDDAGYVGSGQIYGTQFFKYVPATNNWTQLSSPLVSHSNTEAFVIGEKAYCMDAGSNLLYSYDTTTDTWEQKNNMPFSLSFWNSSFSIGEYGYVKAGHALWQYKATTDEWASRASFPGFATGGSVAFTQNGKGYIVGGYAGSLSEVQSEVWEYDFWTNAWTLLPEFPGSSRRFSVGFTINNRAYMGTGTNGTNFNDFWEFDALAQFNEAQGIHPVQAYPNPATSKISFVGNSLAGSIIQISDITGKIVRKGFIISDNYTVHRNGLESGTYFYTIYSGDKILHTNKFIFN